MAILHHYAPVVEGAGIDEAYFDLSFTGSYDRAAALARQIQGGNPGPRKAHRFHRHRSNKMVAKIASDFHKPDALTLVTPGEAEDFLALWPCGKSPAFGPKTEKSLARQGIKTVKDLKAIYPGGTLRKIRQVGSIAL